MITAMGHRVDFKHPEYTIIDSEDLRIHTSNMCRYNGALNWKLVRHLNLCAKLIAIDTEENMQRPAFDPALDMAIQQGYAAAHDLHEIYVGDVVSGMKKYMPEYQKLETAWEHWVHGFIGLPIEQRDHKLIRHVDVRALVIEMDMLDHPAAERVATIYGGFASQTERQAFLTVARQSPEECWRQTWLAVTKAVNLLRGSQTEKLSLI